MGRRVSGEWAHRRVVVAGESGVWVSPGESRAERRHGTADTHYAARARGMRRGLAAGVGSDASAGFAGAAQETYDHNLGVRSFSRV